MGKFVFILILVGSLFLIILGVSLSGNIGPGVAEVRAAKVAEILEHLRQSQVFFEDTRPARELAYSIFIVAAACTAVVIVVVGGSYLWTLVLRKNRAPVTTSDGSVSTVTAPNGAMVLYNADDPFAQAVILTSDGRWEYVNRQLPEEVMRDMIPAHAQVKVAGHLAACHENQQRWNAAVNAFGQLTGTIQTRSVGSAERQKHLPASQAH